METECIVPMDKLKHRLEQPRKRLLALQNPKTIHLVLKNSRNSFICDLVILSQRIINASRLPPPASRCSRLPTSDFSETARSAERSCFSNLHVPCPWGASLKLELVPPSKSFFSNPSRVLPVGCF